MTAGIVEQSKRNWQKVGDSGKHKLLIKSFRPIGKFKEFSLVKVAKLSLVPRNPAQNCNKWGIVSSWPLHSGERRQQPKQKN